VTRENCHVAPEPIEAPEPQPDHLFKSHPMGRDWCVHSVASPLGFVYCGEPAARHHSCPEPQPARHNDLVFAKAAQIGWDRYHVEDQGLGSLPDFTAALRLAYDYLLIHDRRGAR